MTEVVIIGAGPYGLSTAAHLRSLGVSFRIFGRPMQNWRTRMPRGMLLKSDPYASSLSAPDPESTLEAFCRARGIPYADEGIPVPLQTFIGYGEAFQRHYVPEIEERTVVSVERAADGFAIRLDNGEVARGRKVVVAVGVSDFARTPAALAQLPREYMTHASEHGDLDAFRGREMAVVGAGSSAIDLAALLQEGGASVQLVARHPELRFHSRANGAVQSLADRLRMPKTGIGPGWRNVFFTRTPHWFRHLPADIRQRLVEKTHGPAGAWFMRDRVVGKIPVVEGAPSAAEIRDGRVTLHLADQSGAAKRLSVDHVIAATGYRVDLRRLSFLGEALRGQIALIAQAPELSARFESSVPGLYFTGPAAAYAFGPVFRFVVGCEFAAPRLARHLAATASRKIMTQGAVLAPRQRAA